MRRTVGVLPVVVTALSFLGCGGEAVKPPPVEKLVPVSGIVEIDGKPESGVQVKFFPGKNTQSRGGIGVTDESGEFRVRNYQSKLGLVVGEYTVTLSLDDSEGSRPMINGNPIPFVSFKEKIPPKWSELGRAGAHNKIVVPEGGTKDLKLKVQSK